MDDDSDGVIKVDQVTKVVEILGRQDVELTPKQINQIIDMLHKEEMMEVESNIEKVLVTEAPAPAAEEEKGELDVRPAQEALADPAKDLTEQEPEEHIRDMFGDNKKEGAVKASGAKSGQGKPPINLK